MEIEYCSNDVCKKCIDPTYALKSGLPKKTVEKLKVLMQILKGLDNVSPFVNLPALKHYCLEWLKGNKKHIMSLRIDNKYRLEFRSLVGKQEYIKITGIEVKEISNHYGD